jgi:superfamily I DNA/RNA helicase/RecB family exonuclease
LREVGRIDYGTLLAEATSLLRDETVQAVECEKTSHVLADEYQDTTFAQASMLRALAGGPTNLTVAADPYQSVFSFRGAEITNVAAFPEDFPDDTGAPAKRLVLTQSFRVPALILDAAVRVTERELPGAAGKVVAAPGPGSVETYRFEQQTQEAEWIAGEIERLHLEQQLPYSRMAVFVRSKRRLLSDLSRSLERRGVPHDRPDARLVDRPSARFILDGVLAATGEAGEQEVDRAVRRMLLGPLFRMPLGALRDLERERAARSWSWAEAVARRVPEGAPLAALLDDTAWATEAGADRGLWQVWSTLPQIGALVSDPDRGDELAAWTSLNQVVDSWTERNPGATLVDYARLVESETFEARPLLSFRAADDDSVTLTTLHQSKGLDFDVVFIADAVEGVFPDLRARDSLLGARYLSPNLPTETAEYRAFRLNEERRLAYTAMTRASRRVVWTATTAGAEQNQGPPSRFLALVADVPTVAEAVTAPPARTKPITPAEAEAYLRRRCANPEEVAVTRAAAVAALAAAPRFGLRPPDSYYGVLAPGPNTGIPIPEALSPSQAEAYERCPRRYVLERRLGIGDRVGFHADFGTLLHRVLEIVETEAAGRGDRHATLDEALATLDDEFDPADFGNEPFATAWRRRAGDTLTHLYEHWPSSGDILGLEVDLNSEIDGVRWRGRADRVEIRNGSVAIVDYKTGRRPPTRNEAAVSIQLGFYVMAAREHEKLAGAGTADTGEMWFPSMRQKQVATREVDIGKLDEIREKMNEIAAGIAAEKWPATPNDLCDRCSVRLVCPAWPEGVEAFST